MSQRKASHVVAAKVAEVQAAIDLLPSTTNDGEVATEEDILTQVLSKDRPGRVRRLGAGVTKTKLGAGSQSDSKYDELKFALNKETARRKKMEIILAKKLGINLDKFDDDDDVSEEHNTSISKNQVQCDASATSEVKTPMSGQGSTHHHSVNDKCKLLNWKDNGEVVPVGSLSVMDPKSTVHGILWLELLQQLLLRHKVASIHIASQCWTSCPKWCGYASTY